MKTKNALWIILLLCAIAILPGCQAAPATAPVVSSKSAAAASLPTAAPSPTLRSTPTEQPITAPSPAVPPTQQNQGDEAANAAQAYFTAVSAGKSDEAAKMLSSFSLAVFQMTRGDATDALQAQKNAGVRWSDFRILGTQSFDAQTVLVHATYSETGKATPTAAATPKTAANATPAPTQTAAAGTVDVLWPMRLERGEWRYNWENVIDFRTLNVEAQTMNGITILPTQLTRYSDRIQVSMLVQNRKNETVVFGLANETLGTFYFGDQTVIAEKAQWILNPLRAVPAATLEIKGLFTSLPDKMEIRKWSNNNVKPWFVFQLQ